ncbi:MAG: NAD(P)-dependent oxidoreductase [Deltaproteobacteria bacterium]|nr:MAG: NAD(P)-dependent oxidoreductase [Deltaproteobacteria bacterium]
MGLPRLLITGSRGRIGTVLMEALADSFEVYGVDIQDTAGERSFRADIADYEQLSSALQLLAPIPFIVHLAADPRVGAGWNSVLNNNIIGTKNLYEAAKEYGVKKVVFASSNHVTGAYEGIPPSLHKQDSPRLIAVNDPVRPDSDYGTSKVFGEAVARQYYELYRIHSVCLRIGSFIADDNPTRNERVRRTWVSHRDLIQLVKKSILSEVEFGIYYGVSGNKGRFWDISNAEEEIGYCPEDDASVV